MGLFQQYNIPLTVGLSGGAIGTDPVLTQTIKTLMNPQSGFQMELACNGILAEDYSTLSSARQQQYMALCSQRINSVFGVYPSSFIPPLGRFNRNTIPSMINSGYDVLSSFTQFDMPPYIDTSSPVTVYRWPANAFTGMMTSDGFNPSAAAETLSQIGFQLTNFGFAVVSVNPMGFASAADSSNVDPAAMAELATVLQTVIGWTEVSSTVLSELSSFL
jgi:peptidoglycan/xylan/chitin deacetylase (PgdA/CDA1 family)